MARLPISIFDSGLVARLIDAFQIGSDYRQVFVQGDSVTSAAVVKVTNAVPATSDYATVVRRPPLALPYRLVTAASTNAAAIKASAGVVFKVEVFNNAAYPVHVKFYNKASSPTVGSDTVVFSVSCQASVSVVAVPDGGCAFTTGIAISVVKNVANTDTTAVAASDAIVHVFYE